MLSFIRYIPKNSIEKINFWTSKTNSTIRVSKKRFTKLGVKILQIPSLDEIRNGTKQIEFLKEIEIEDLLQRESVIAD